MSVHTTAGKRGALPDSRRLERVVRHRGEITPPAAMSAGAAIPDDRELKADLCKPRWKLTVRGIQVESKDDIIKRIGHSPDKGDSLVYASASKFTPGEGWVAF